METAIIGNRNQSYASAISDPSSTLEMMLLKIYDSSQDSSTSRLCASQRITNRPILQSLKYDSLSYLSG